MTRRRKSGGGGPGRQAGAREWIGGTLDLPLYVTDREEPYRPGHVVWMDAADGTVVSQSLIGPDEAEGALGRALLAVLERPGPRRRPGRLRVATDDLADDVRASVGDAIPVRVAPTPELQALADFMLDRMAEEDDDGDASYLEDGRVSSGAVERLFDAARVLHVVAPWKVAEDTQLLRVDVPAHGVEGACISIIGDADVHRGFVMWPSLEGFLAFAEAGERLPQGSGPVDLGSTWLALIYESASELPPGMRREAMAHGWRVADADAYPRVERRDRDGALRPLVEGDVDLAGRVARALGAFFVRHAGIFEREEFEPVSESQLDEDEIEVRLTVPYEAFDLFGEASVEVEPAETAPPPAPARRAGRNDPCPCGSGRKYKKCHLAEDEAARAARAAAERLRELDGRLSGELLRFARRHLGPEWSRYAEAFADVDECRHLAATWAVYGYAVEGRTAAEAWSSEPGHRPSREERAWIAAQQAAWLSVWEVTGVERGVAISLRDRLSHEERRVSETGASRTLDAGDAILARVVDHEGMSLLSGVHPWPLPPQEAADLVRRARARLRRRRAVPVERLRETDFARYLIRRWDAAVDELDGRPDLPPDPPNGDGDSLRLVADRFDLAPGARGRVAKLLMDMGDVEPGEAPPRAPAGESRFLFMGTGTGDTGERPILGIARLSDAELWLETSSSWRAAELRARLEADCGPLIRHRARERFDPFSPPAERGAAARSRRPRPKAEQMALGFERDPHAEWLDQPLPALEGRSPREAVGTPAGREAVELLLREMESLESRAASDGTLDVRALRRELRLEHPDR